jgi:GT2 family glycosyltransferase
MPNALAVPREVLVAVGGFDEEHFPFHYDEGDLAQRIRAMGRRVVVVRDAGVWHFGGTSVDPGLEMFRGLELGGRRRVQSMAYARVYFHRRHTARLKKLAALGLFIPIWALIVLLACLLRPTNVRAKREVVSALISGLVRGYARTD